MEPVSTISAALTSAKAAWEILSAAVNARDEARIQSATLELRERLFAMSDIAMSFIEKNAALVQENSALKLAHTALENEHAKLKDEVSDSQNYALKELETGALVLAYQPAMEGGQDTNALPLRSLQGHGPKVHSSAVQTLSWHPVS